MGDEKDENKLSKLKIRLFIPVDAMIRRRKFVVCDFFRGGLENWKVESRRACEHSAKRSHCLSVSQLQKKIIRRGRENYPVKLNYSSKLILKQYKNIVNYAFFHK